MSKNSRVSDSLVIIPTYKERENIERILRKVFSLPKVFHVLVVEDNSPDGTADIVKSLMKEFPEQLFIEERKGKLGLGTAYIHGFKWALKKGYDYIYEMDADFSHNPEDLIRLYSACADDGADLAIGSRYIKGVNVVNWPMGRILMSYFASVYVRMITRMKIQDTTAGFKCYKAEVLRAIDLDSIKFTGYAFQIEMKFTAWKLGFKLKEVDIIFTDRTEGESKMNKSIFKEAIFGVIDLRFRAMFNKIRRAA
ncbi:MAG: polyprenol monophosphomannose synthase [Bacteroidales bacterium]